MPTETCNWQIKIGKWYDSWRKNSISRVMPSSPLQSHASKMPTFSSRCPSNCRRGGSNRLQSINYKNNNRSRRKNIKGIRVRWLARRGLWLRSKTNSTTQIKSGACPRSTSSLRSWGHSRNIKTITSKWSNNLSRTHSPILKNQPQAKKTDCSINLTSVPFNIRIICCNLGIGRRIRRDKSRTSLISLNSN